MFTNHFELEYTPTPHPHVPAVNPSLFLHILASKLFTVCKPQNTALLQAFIIGNETMSKLYVTVGV